MKNISYGNRGMAFEQLIDYSNRMYDNKGIAVINKRPTPIKILNITGNRVNGCLEKPSTVDYDGTYQGLSIVFEAKSVSLLDRFDFKNLHDHQVEYLAKCHKQGAISFLLVEFLKHRKVYLLPYAALKPYWEAQSSKVRGSKSLSLETFDIHGYQVDAGRVPLDYLSVVVKVWKLDRCWD